MTDKGSYARGTLTGLAQLFKEVNSVGDIQKEIASVEEFEKTLTFQYPIPVSWAIWKYKALHELIEQKDAEIKDLREACEAILAAHNRRGAVMTAACGDNDAVIKARLGLSQLGKQKS
jgi:hypothetical protein